MEIIILISVNLVFLFLTFLFFTKNQKSDKKNHSLEMTQRELETKLSNKDSIVHSKEKDIQIIKEELKESKSLHKSDIEKLISMREQNDFLKKEIERIKRDQIENQETLKNEFKVLANEILKNNTKEFSSNLLSPFQEKMVSFEKKMLESFEKEMRDKISLREEVKKLNELNFKISEEANNLTKALKGDQKQQGNWGEFILESILEKSGLEKNNEYQTQQSFIDENGKRVLPDLIIKLPENKNIIVDSKVSLTAFERYINTENPEEKHKHLKEHILSFKNHVKNLSEKNYHLIPDINTPEFVLLFTPIEASFTTAMKNEPDLFQFAWEKNIVLVSPTTLLATLRTISSVWKQEKQTKNALKIAEETGKLYDSFVRFLESLEDIGKHINKTQHSYETAFKRLHTGKGNLIKKVEDIQKLGIKSSKHIDSKYLGDEE